MIGKGLTPTERNQRFAGPKNRYMLWRAHGVDFESFTALGLKRASHC